MNEQAPANMRAVVAHRIIQLGLLIALMWKIRFFYFAAQVYEEIPLADPFFPDWLRSVAVLRIVYVATVGSVLCSLFASTKGRIACAVVTFVGASILCMHQGSYNDMTFVTAWWTSLWNLWFVFRMDDSDQEPVLRRGALLSRLIISMILLGGAIGKWTAEYWSGEVFWDIYFRDRQFWVFNLLRENFSEDALREISKWYSRKVVVIETIAGFGLWLLPARVAGVAAIILLLSIAIFSNFNLFSVLLSLVGLAAVGLLVPGRVNGEK